MQLDTLTLCIVIALGGALLISVGMMFRAWRDASNSAYYFHRKQSMSSMQSYALTSVVLGVLLIALTTFASTPTTNSDPLIRVIRNAKPSSQLIIEPSAVQPVIEAREAQEAQGTQIIQSSTEDGSELTESFEPNTRAVPLLLAEPEVALEVVQEATEDQLVVENAPEIEIVEEVAPEVDVVEDAGPAVIKNVVFSTQITDGFAAANPGIVFDSGYYTMYATFQHENMVRGTTWSWQWTRNGAVVGSGSREWVDNPDGYGYVYFNPTDGFATGDYQLTIWVNSQLSDSGAMRITSNVAQ